MATAKLTKSRIDRLSPSGKDVFEWCAELRGFGVRVKPSGVKSFLVQYRNEHGRSRRHTIGRYGVKTPEQARKEAKRLLGQVEGGGDPASDRKDKRSAMTVGELCDEYFAAAKVGRILYRGRPKKASTLSVDKGRINRHIKPLLGDLRLEELTINEVEDFLHDVTNGKTAVCEVTGPRGIARVTGGKGTAKKSVHLLSAIMRYGVKRRLIARNPCLGAELPPDGKNTKALTPEEYRRVGLALDRLLVTTSHSVAIHAIRALALTGCRKSEVLSLKLDDLHARNNALRLQDTKTRDCEWRPCGETATRFMEKICETSGHWVFPSPRTDGHLADPSKQLENVKKIAKIPDLTPHVFRHSYATVAGELGYNEFTVAALLGHAAGTVTAQYVHAVESVLIDAANNVSVEIDRRMRGK